VIDNGCISDNDDDRCDDVFVSDGSRDDADDRGRSPTKSRLKRLVSSDESDSGYDTATFQQLELN